MEPVMPASHNGFCEEEWIKLLYTISDTQQWVDELGRSLFQYLPLTDKRKLFRKTYYLTAPALVHILERHYYKVPRHPGAGKFTIPLLDMLHYLREAGSRLAVLLNGSFTYIRVMEAERVIGFDRNNIPTRQITVLTDSGGKIITAFPGIMD
jgi:hypothetical protein